MQSDFSKDSNYNKYYIHIETLNSLVHGGKIPET